MKYRLQSLIILILLLWGIYPVYGDASLAAGTEITADLTSPSLNPVLRLDGYFSGYHPFSPVLALTYDSAGDLSYDVTDSFLRGGAFGDIHFSWLMENFRVRTGLTGLVSAGTVPPAYSWSVTADAEAGYDTFKMSLSVHPSLTLRGIEDQTAAGFDGEVELEGVIAVSPAVLFSTVLSGGISRSVYDNGEYYAGVNTGVTWYTPKSVVFNGFLRWLRHKSDYREELVSGEPAVPADSYHLFEAAVQTDLSFSSRIRGSFGIPVELYLKDHSAAASGSYLNQKEIDLLFSPDISVWFDFSGSLTLESGLGGVFVFSNSPANRYSGITLEAGLRYHF
jgi:hypothetical protein